MEMTQEILKRLDALAAKLGTTGQYLWTVLVKQARVEAYFDLVMCCLLLAMAALLFTVSVKVFRGWDVEDGSVVMFCFGVGVLALCAMYGHSAAMEAFNPDYWALHQLKEIFTR